MIDRKYQNVIYPKNVLIIFNTCQLKNLSNGLNIVKFADVSTTNYNFHRKNKTNNAKDRFALSAECYIDIIKLILNKQQKQTLVTNFYL